MNKPGRGPASPLRPPAGPPLPRAGGAGTLATRRPAAFRGALAAGLGPGACAPGGDAGAAPACSLTVNKQGGGRASRKPSGRPGFGKWIAN